MDSIPSTTFTFKVVNYADPSRFPDGTATAIASGAFVAYPTFTYTLYHSPPSP